jgi:hypothetical protein
MAYLISTKSRTNNAIYHHPHLIISHGHYFRIIKEKDLTNT